MTDARSACVVSTSSRCTPSRRARSPKVRRSQSRRSARRAVAMMTRGRAARAMSTWMRPMGPAPMTTTTPPGSRPLLARRGRVRSGCVEVHVVRVRRDDAADGLGDGGVGGRQGGVRERQEAAGRQDLLADEHVLREQPGQRVADRDLGHAPPLVAIALAVLDGGDVHGRLDGHAHARPILVAQVRTHLHERHDTFVADDDRVRSGIPAVHERMGRTLVEQLVDRRADARRIDARQQLPGSGSRHRHAAHGQVIGARAVEHRGPHRDGDGCAGLAGQDGAHRSGATERCVIGRASEPGHAPGQADVLGTGEGPDGRRGQGADGRPEPGCVLAPPARGPGRRGRRR